MTPALSLATPWLALGLRLAASLTLQRRAPDKVFEVHLGSCSCDLRSLECLPAQECLESVRAKAGENIESGRQVRAALRSSIQKEAHQKLATPGVHPLGKVITYGAIFSWEQWIEGRGLPAGWSGFSYGKWVDVSRFAECQAGTPQSIGGQSAVTGANCFWKAFDAEDNVGEVEREAGAGGGSISGRGAGAVRQDLEAFRRSVLASPEAEVSADMHFMSMAHIAYIQFNIQSSLESSYSRHLVTIPRQRADPGLGQLRVGLHIRRADSCSELNKDGYQQEASTITTHAQMTNVRLCYDARVYVDALKRIFKLYQLPLIVHVSSDNVGSILAEIEAHDHDFFRAHTWRFLDWPRGGFKYDLTVEFQNNTESGFLGETAAVEAWHLSHSEVFVGHLGSRYGKGAYLLASARRNVPVPYVSVDGHNYCCQSDEQCAKATAALTGIIDCLTFAPEMTHSVVNRNDTYWTEGVTQRFDREPSERNIFLHSRGKALDPDPEP